MKIILKGRIPSKKNSKQIINRGGRSFLISSVNYRLWEEAQLWLLPKIKAPIQECRINAYFYFPDRLRADLSNKFESIADLLVKGNILQDDNWKVLKEVHQFAMGVDKLNPRVEIEII